MAKINFITMQSELIKIFEDFLKNPEDKIVRERIVDYDREFGGLSSYNDYLKRQPVPKYIINALNGLPALYQYGVWEDNHQAFSKKKIIDSAKKILEELKKSEK